jgi:hypothetical protein
MFVDNNKYESYYVGCQSESWVLYEHVYATDILNSTIFSLYTFSLSCMVKYAYGS